MFVSGYLCDVYGHLLFMKKTINKNHILHRLDDKYQSQVPPHILAHAKLVTRVSVNGYLCEVNGHPLFMKKNQYF